MPTALTNTIRVVAICGSLRRPSYTRLALAIALAGAARAGAETTLLELPADLPLCDGRSNDETYPACVHEMRATVRAADAIIIGTPEYHGGMSGVLKNALDLMGKHEFGGKMVGLVGVSGGRLGAVNALNALRAVGRSLHAWVLPDQVTIPQASNAFHDDGTLRFPELDRRLQSLGAELVRFARLHRVDEQALAFLQQWQNAMHNPNPYDD